jgi:hypothetical protein
VLVDPELREAALAALPPPAAPPPVRPALAVAPAPRPVRRAGLRTAALVVAATGVFATGSSAEQRPSVSDAARPAAAHAVFVPRSWVWPRVKDAALYRVSFLRRGRMVLVAWPAAPPLVLQRGVRFGPGAYEWRVQPVFWRHGDAVVARPVVRSRFTVAP